MNEKPVIPDIPDTPVGNDSGIGAEPNSFWHPIQHSQWEAQTNAYADFKDLTTGLDPRGIQRVLEDQIKIGIIDEAKKKIKDSEHYAEFKKLCEANWKGDARRQFFKKVEEDQDLVVQDMDNEYWSIYNRFNEMITSYRNEDIQLGQDI